MSESTLDGLNEMMSVSRDGDLRPLTSSTFQADAWFMSALQGCTDGIWEYDPATKGFFCSAQFKKVLGYAPHESIAENDKWWNLNTHPDDIERCREYFAGVIKSNKNSYALESRILTKRGEYIHLLFKGQIMRDGEGYPLRIAGVITDITPHRQ